MKKVVIAIIATLAWGSAGATPGFFGFAAGAFVQGPPSGTPVPTVIGLATGAADTAITGAGFIVGSTAVRCSADTINTVVSQTPGAGVLAANGSGVDYLYSSGVPCKNSGLQKPRLHFPF